MPTETAVPPSRRSTKPAAVALAVLSLVLPCPQARSQDGPGAVRPAPAVDAWPLEIDRGAARLWQTLLQLRTRASLMMVTAHPDDEDGGMLAYEARGKGTRAILMTLTRGEGGQNIMSDDFFDALGLVRTEELLAADRYYGVEQYWSSVVDFGFSKTREEGLRLWGRERVLEDLVRVVRLTRPLVITSTFVGGPTDGHGHHGVAGEMAQEVFRAAGDPNRFPEQIRAGLRPWSPLKMYARVPSFSVSEGRMYDSAARRWNPVRFYNYIRGEWTEGALATHVEIPSGNYDPVLGATYVQIGRQGWSLQKSQNGGGRIPYAGPGTTPYHRFASTVAAGETEQSFFDGVDVTLAGIADLASGEDNGFLREGLGRVSALVEWAMREFSVQRPDVIAPVLAEGLKEMNALAAQAAASGLSERAQYDVLHEIRIKQQQFQRAITEALGITLNATAAAPPNPGQNRFFAYGPTETFAFAVPGQSFPVTVHLNNPASTAVTIRRIWLETPEGEHWTISPTSPVPASLPARAVLDQEFRVAVPENAAPTRPYFTRQDEEHPYYDIRDERYRNLSYAPYPLTAWVEFVCEGAEVRVGQVVQTARQQTGQGLVLNPLMVTPAVSVKILPMAGVTPLGEEAFTLSALVHTEAQDGATGTVRLELPASWRSEPATAEFALERAGEQQAVTFRVFPGRLEERPYTITAVAESGGKQYREGFTTVGYAGLRPYNHYTPASYRTTGVNVTMTPGLRIGYVMGTGDAVPQSLENLGVKAEFLSPQDLAQGDLRRYDLILLGVRAYAARPELATHNSRLLEYVRNGGVVVVQYNSAEYDRNFGPYPYRLPNNAERVADETAPVQFVDPSSPVLTWPNRLTQRDFEGWIEERGHGFLDSWDSRYEAPLETHDPGQPEQRGGMIYARYGRGVYVYVAFALYRQLPYGVPGAYRFMANLLSLPRNPAFREPATAGVASAGVP